MSSGIYCIRNNLNGHIYIGQSIDVERRKGEHWRQLSRNRDNCVLLQNAVNKYGLENFSFLVLLKCLPEDLDEMEMSYIDSYKSSDRRYGYNLSVGGSNGLRGVPKSDETRKRMSVANTKERHPMWGKKHSPETIQLYKDTRRGERAYQFGKKSSDSTSKFFGVNKMITRGKYVYWVAHAKVRGVNNYIGCSKDEETAARMYDKYIIENGLPNPLNFPEE